MGSSDPKEPFLEKPHTGMGIMSCKSRSFNLILILVQLIQDVLHEGESRSSSPHRHQN